MCIFMVLFWFCLIQYVYLILQNRILFGNWIFFQNAPKPKKKIKDLFDLNGTTPYKTEEIVPGKLWEITYTFENSARFDEDAKNEMKAFGMVLIKSRHYNIVLKFKHCIALIHD